MEDDVPEEVKKSVVLQEALDLQTSFLYVEHKQIFGK
jgi:hypothetical protein